MEYRFRLLYTRQEIGLIRKAKIALCGLGGYGSVLVDPLARYEIGELRLADPDYFETSNLDRQSLAKFSTVGNKKVDTAAKLIEDITTRTTVIKYSDGVTVSNICRFCKDTNVVIDLCDKLSIKILLHFMCSKLKVPLLTGGSASWPNRNNLIVSIYRYDKEIQWKPDQFPHRKWGITNETWAEFLKNASDAVFNPSILKAVDEENAVYRSKNPPKIYGGEKTIYWNAGGGYDPLKIFSLATKILECVIYILIKRRPKHHKIKKDIEP